MTHRQWNERDQDWRGARGWDENGGSGGQPRQSDQQRFSEGHNPAGPNQGYGDAGYRETRSWNATERGEDYGYGGGGREDYGGDQRRFSQADSSLGADRGRYGDERYGHEGRSGRAYGYDRQDSRSQGPGQGYVRGAYGEGYGGGRGYDDRGGDSSYGYGARDRGSDSQRGYGRQRYGQQPVFQADNEYVQSVTDGDRQGAHHGKGPSDYRRSDDRVREDVNDRLTDDHHIDASGIQVQVQEGEVTLSGTVSERFAKRHAEDLAERVSGVKHVQNNLRVSDGSQTRSTATSAAGATGSSAGSAQATARGTSNLS